MDWEIIYRKLMTINWIALILLTLLSLLTMNLRVTFGIIAGGLLATANFIILQNILKRVLIRKNESKPRRAFLLISLYLRLISMALITGILLKMGWLNPIGLLIGVSTIVISISLVGLVTAFRVFRPEVL
jgi:hypothetical protein